MATTTSGRTVTNGSIDAVMTAAAVEDFIVPPFDDTTVRKSSIVVATFNLVATIVGGGVLSVPYAFSRCGLVLGTILMIVAAVTTERTLFLLCLCQRMTGATTYGEVGEAAFGRSGDHSTGRGGGSSSSSSTDRGKYVEWMISLLLGLFLIFVIIAYMVLVEDIWTSVFLGSTNGDSNRERSVLLVTVLLMFPFFIQQNLHSLRFNCYVGFISITILCIALVHHALVTATTVTTASSVLLWSTNVEDVLVAFPIITLSFLSIFNILPIQNALIRPTRIRTLQVIDLAVMCCFVLMLVFGVAGYLYSFPNNTDGNILNNVAHDDGGWSSDRLMFLGKVGCGVTIMLAMPMMLLPCRQSLLEVLDVVLYGPHHAPVEDEETAMVHEISNLEKEKDPKAPEFCGESTCLLANKRLADSNGSIPSNNTVTPKLPTTESIAITTTTAKENDNIQNNRRHLSEHPVVHYSSTVAIVAICYVTAVRIPGGVATVWSIIGCFMGYLLAFILPAMCYIMINERFPNHTKVNSPIWLQFSWVLLFSLIVVSILCTIETVNRLFFSGRQRTRQRQWTMIKALFSWLYIFRWFQWQQSILSENNCRRGRHQYRRKTQNSAGPVAISPPTCTKMAALVFILFSRTHGFHVPSLPSVRGSRATLQGYESTRSDGENLHHHYDNEHAQIVIPAGCSVTLKLAMDEQGGVADLSCGTSERFTCSDSLDMVHRLRRCSDAVLVGRSTVEDDDCTLTVRRVPPIPDSSRPSQPVRVIIDPQLQLRLENFRLSSDNVPTVVIHIDFLSSDAVSALEDDDDDGDALTEMSDELTSSSSEPRPAGTSVRSTLSRIDDFPDVTFVGIPSRLRNDTGVDLPTQKRRPRLSARDICSVLHREFGIRHLMVEGGPTTARQFLEEGVVDRAIIVTAPMSFRDPLLSRIDHRTMEVAGLEQIGQARIGDDKIEYFSRPGLSWPASPVTSWP